MLLDLVPDSRLKPRVAVGVAGLRKWQLSGDDLVDSDGMVLSRPSQLDEAILANSPLIPYQMNSPSSCHLVLFFEDGISSDEKSWNSSQLVEDC